MFCTKYFILIILITYTHSLFCQHFEQNDITFLVQSIRENDYDKFAQKMRTTNNI